MGITPESPEKEIKLLMHHRVHGDVILELFLLLGIREFAVQQQVAGFKVFAVLGQLLNRVATMQQNAFVTVDIGDEIGRASCRERV